MNKKTNRGPMFFFFFLTFAAAMILFFYSANTPAVQESDPKASIVFLPKVIDENNDFWVDMTEGAELAASENDIDLTIMGPDAETKYQEQNQMIEKAIAMQPNAIALVPADYEKTVPYAKKIEEAGIKLIVIDSVMKENMGSCVVATDNTEAGRKMAQYMLQYVNDSSVIGIVGHIKGTSTATEREQGIRDGLGQYENKIVDVVFCNSNYDKAYQVTKQMLAEHPDMNMIFGLNEYSSVGAARAIKELGLAGKVHMMGFDSSIEEVKLLEEGVFDGIVVQKPLNMGYLGITMAYQASLNNNVQENVDSGSKLITGDDIYTEENEKLLFRFSENE